jgi:hypothetical protein
MRYQDIDLMTSGQWINYREDLIEDFYSRGFVLNPIVDCITCDIDNDYICFDCECKQLDSAKG